MRDSFLKRGMEDFNQCPKWFVIAWLISLKDLRVSVRNCFRLSTICLKRFRFLCVVVHAEKTFNRAVNDLRFVFSYELVQHTHICVTLKTLINYLHRISRVITSNLFAFHSHPDPFSNDRRVVEETFFFQPFKKAGNAVSTPPPSPWPSPWGSKYIQQPNLTVPHKFYFQLVLWDLL